MTEAATSRAVVVRLLEAFGRGDFDTAANLFAMDATLWVVGNLPFSGTLVGRKEIAERNLIPSGKLSLPGSTSIELGMIISHGQHVAAEWVFKRKTLDGRDYANAFCGLFEVREGEITKMREYLDTLYAKEMLWSS